MKSPYAHASRTALALVAAAGILVLAAFVRPGAGEQPIPLLPAIGSAAEKIVAAPEAHPTKPERAPAVRRTTAVAAFVAAPVAPAAPVRQTTQPRHHAVQRPHRAHPRRLAPPAKHFTAAPVSSSAAPRGRAVGWHRKHDQAASAPSAAPERRHGKSHAKHDVAAPNTRAHGNGKHHGNGHGHGGQGQGQGQGHGHGGKQ